MRIVFFRVQLEEQNRLLRRIAEALERLSPVLPAHEPPARKSDLSDLRVVNPAEQRLLQELEAAYADEWGTVPGSDAYQKAKKDFEDQVREWSGQAAVDELPWNRIGRQG